MVRVVPTAEAERDLEDIDRYSFAQFGEAVAHDYMIGFDAIFARLSDLPESGPIYEGVKPAIRCVTYRSHKIFYDFDGVQVVIIRILHSAMNAERILN